MPRNRSAEEVKRDHIERMGEELGSLYTALQNEVAWVYSKWWEYVELFGTKPSRVELLNKAAPYFFRIVQDSLWEDILLHIARLTERTRTAGKRNLTIQRLPWLVVDEKVGENITELTNSAIAKADFCKDWRNRHIAHRDLKLALDQAAEPLKAASHAKVKDVLDNIAAVLNAVSQYYMNSTTSFEEMRTLHGAVSLLYILDSGLKAKEERLQRIEKGDYRPADLKAPDL